MAQFPKKEEEVLQLAEKVLVGLRADKKTYPEPAVDLDEFTAAIDSYRHAAAEKLKAMLASKMAVINKNRALDVMAENLKTQLRYAEIISDSNDKKLRRIGWGTKKEPAALPAPGQPLELIAVRQPDASLKLSWKPPAGCSNNTAYKVMRSVNAEPVSADDGAGEVNWVGDWEFAATACAARASLTDQPQGVILAYRIIAISKAGESKPSDAVPVVL